MATLTDVGGLPGVGTGFLQPKQQNKWRVTFLGFGGLPSSQPLSLQAKKVGRPDLTFADHQLHRYNSYANVLGKHSFGDLSITFDDDIGSSAARIIQAQLQRQQHIIGAEGPYLAAAQEGSIYKFATIVDMLNGNDTVLETWTYEGCMITNHKGTDLDYSTSDLVDIDLTIKIDHAFQCFPNIIRDNLALGGAGIPC
jgi:hypothetical protein